MNEIETEPITTRPVDKKALAEFYGVTPRTIENQMKLGMPYVKIGRLPRFVIPEVAEWLKSRAGR